MTDKYYIPDISEFHIGFEYEFRPRVRRGIVKYIREEHEHIGRWKKQTIGKESETCLEILVNFGDPYSIEDVISYHKYNAIRVKYLDREDIESLGWEFTVGCNISGETFHKRNNHTIHYIPKNKRCMILLNDDGGNISLFQGIIRNKSELKKVLEMIGIS